MMEDYRDMKIICEHLPDILSHKTTSVQKSPVSLITVFMQNYSITEEEVVYEKRMPQLQLSKSPKINSKLLHVNLKSFILNIIQKSKFQSRKARFNKRQFQNWRTTDVCRVFLCPLCLSTAIMFLKFFYCDLRADFFHSAQPKRRSITPKDSPLTKHLVAAAPLQTKRPQKKVNAEQSKRKMDRWNACLEYRAR